MLKITTTYAIFMFLTSALIIPIGTSYATYGDSPAFVPNTPTPSNETNTNMTMPTPTPSNETNTNMTMPTPTPSNETNTNMTMPTPTPSNETNTNMTMPTPTPSNETNTNMTMPTPTPSNETNTTPKPSAPLDPLKQFNSGVPAKDVQCQSGFSLVLKASDGSPACVHPAIVQILILRGWAAIQ